MDKYNYCLTLDGFYKAIAEKDWHNSDTVRVETAKTIYALGKFDGCYLWADNGCEAMLLILNAYKGNRLVGDAVNLIKQRIEEYESGYIHCTECDIKMKADEYAERLSAGNLCKECWERVREI